MKRIEYFHVIAELFAFKTILDERGNEYVVFQNSVCENLSDIENKTAFEALENHVHLLDNIKKREFEPLSHIAEDLSQTLLNSLKFHYPNKKFYVYATVHRHDSFIIRFHQNWEDEVPYMDPNLFVDHSRERVIMLAG